MRNDAKQKHTHNWRIGGLSLLRHIAIATWHAGRQRRRCTLEILVLMRRLIVLVRVMGAVAAVALPRQCLRDVYVRRQWYRSGCRQRRRYPIGIAVECNTRCCAHRWGTAAGLVSAWTNRRSDVIADNTNRCRVLCQHVHAFRADDGLIAAGCRCGRRTDGMMMMMMRMKRMRMMGVVIRCRCGHCCCCSCACMVLLLLLVLMQMMRMMHERIKSART